MDHQLVHGIEEALGWNGAEGLGGSFARGALPDFDLCARLLTPTQLLDMIMRRSLSAARISCLQEGKYIHPQDYLRTRQMRRAEPIHLVDMRRLSRLLQQGCTVVLDAINVYDPTLEVACRALQWWSRELVQVNAYLTTGEAAGFQLHWDDHDVVIVQVAGEKSWDVRGLSRPVPMFRDAVPNFDAPTEVVWNGTLKAGEIMHIPRGYWHQATRQDKGDGYSLHLTFGFPKRTGVDYLTWMADQSRQEELFRRDVNRWGNYVERAEQQLIFTDAAVRLAATRSLAEFLAAREQDLSPTRHVATGGLFGVMTAVVCVTDFPPRIDQQDDRIIVSAVGKKIAFEKQALPALRLLLSGQTVEIDKASAATGADAMLLAEVLVAEEICAELTSELASGYAGVVMPAVQ